MRIGILGTESSWYVRDLNRAARELGHSVTIAPFSKLSVKIGAAIELQTFAVPTKDEVAAPEIATESLADCNGIIVRSMPPGSLEQVVFRMDWLAELHRQGRPMVNPPKSLECAIDKFLSASLLQRAGIAVPETVVCEESETALNAFESLGQDVVVKPIFGSEGRGIMRVCDRELAWRTFRTLERTQSVLLLQRFVQHDGNDVRVLVLDNEILGAIHRSHPSDFRTNVAQAGIARTHNPTAEEQRVALLAARTVGARFAGVDLVYDRQGRLFVLEVNGVPGWKAFAKTTGIDVAVEVCQAVLHASS